MINLPGVKNVAANRCSSTFLNKVLFKEMLYEENRLSCVGRY